MSLQLKKNNTITILILFLFLNASLINCSDSDDIENTNKTSTLQIGSLKILKNIKNKFENKDNKDQKDNNKILADENVIEKKLKADANYVYKPNGKRDPFVQYDASKKYNTHNNEKDNTPLEQYELSQLKLTAILSAGDNPKAMIENETGKGFIVSIGSRVGLNNGVVLKILEDKIIIVETTLNFAGEKKTSTTEMTLRK